MVILPITMVGALAQLFRISISKGYELIPIEKEIQHAKNYLVIQSYRYKDQFTYCFDIDEEVLPYLCNKITIQPTRERTGLVNLFDKTNKIIIANIITINAIIIIILIAPHFLYNTLDSIQWMCEEEKTEDAITMVGALAQLFRISISKGYELIPIEKEIQHAKNYLVIQSYRYL